MLRIFLLLPWTLIPISLSVGFFILQNKTKFGEINNTRRQIIIGILFGLAAIIGTEFGVETDAGAIINIRDAAPICAGLFFGAPAGIIAGFIGGIERFFAVYWGAGAYTRIACSVSTILAGFLAAFFRTKVLNNKIPSPFFASIIPVAIEVVHMLINYLTHIGDPHKAYQIIADCTFPMIIANTFVVVVAICLIRLVDRLFKINVVSAQENSLSYLIQKRLITAIYISFVFTFVVQFAVVLVEYFADVKTAFIDTSESIKREIVGTSDRYVYSVVGWIGLEYGQEHDSLEQLKKKYSLESIDVVSVNGDILESTNKDAKGTNISNDKDFISALKDFEQNFSGAENDAPPIYLSEDEIEDNSGELDLSVYGFYKLHDGRILRCKINEETVSSYLYRSITHIANFDNAGKIDTVGTVLLVDKDGTVITGNRNGKKITIEQYGIDLKDIPEERLSSFLRKTEEGKRQFIYLYYDDFAGYKIVCFVPYVTVASNVQLQFTFSTLLEILILVLLLILIFFTIKRHVVDKLHLVNESLSRITNGNLDETVEVRNTTDFANLSDDVNKTVAALKGYIQEAERRIEAELEFARNIQSSSLPHKMEPFPNGRPFMIDANMYTAKEVGGDFYDFFFLDEDRIAFLVADVSGKGIPAAMFMMRAKTTIRGFLEAGHDIDEAFTLSNEQLCKNNDANMFLTAWLGVLNLKSGEVEFVNAGHNPPLVRRNDCFEYIKCKSGLIMAAMEGFKYKKESLSLSKGDMIYLYTDGVTEAHNIDNELYGEDRLLGILNKNNLDSTSMVSKVVKNDIDKFVGDAKQFDDITMLVLYYGEKRFDELEVDAVTENLYTVQDFITDYLKSAKCDESILMSMEIAIEEIFVNICNYAYSGDKGSARIRLELNNEGEEVEITFFDSGKEYNPLAKEDPDIELSVEERQIGGLGIYMTKQIMNECRYKYENGYNVFTMVKKIK